MRTASFLAALLTVTAGLPASAQVFGEPPARYGITSNLFNYDNRDDRRDFPTNGSFPGNFAASPALASVGTAGWLGMNPQHQAAPYPSQSYFVAQGYALSCPPPQIEAPPRTPARHRKGRILCVSP